MFACAAACLAKQLRQPVISQLLARILDVCLCCREACNGHAEGGAGHVVETDVVAELDGAGIAAVLAADAEVDVGAGEIGRASCRERV